MLALELGGKNTAIVLADAPWEKTLHDVLFSAFVTAGQRCTAVSRLVLERSIADRFCAELVQRAAKLAIGPPQDPNVFMGPLATFSGLEKFHVAQADAAREGARALLASQELTSGPRGYYVSPAIHLVPKVQERSAYQVCEIFGPDLAVFIADDLDQACAIAESTAYGLAAGVFTQSQERFEACASRLTVGCVAWNAPTVGSSSRLPFGGVKHSGNHRPAALFSTLYCAYPVAITRGGATLDTTKLPPGMAWS
jgi:succinylglutamic semialdehyde dehydrogenase